VESSAVFPQALEIAGAIPTFPPHGDCYTHSQNQLRKEAFLRYQPYLFSRLILRLEKTLLARTRNLPVRWNSSKGGRTRRGKQIQAVFETIQHLIEAASEETERRQIGFPTSHAQPHLE
jgi:hypothetical protein